MSTRNLLRDGGSPSFGDSNGLIPRDNGARTPESEGRRENNSNQLAGYEEFFEGSVPCPTCRGMGRIPREKENEMVAIIPLSDKRLKPRRTVMYVCLAVLACVAVAGLLLFFLFPRSVHLQSNSPKLDPTYLYVNRTEEVIHMTFTNEFNVTNANFYPVYVTSLEMMATFDTHVIGDTVNNTELTIPIKSGKTVYAQLNVSFSGDEGYMAHYCAEGGRRPHTLLLPFTTTLTSTALGRTEQSSIKTYQHVRCSKEDL